MKNFEAFFFAILFSLLSLNAARAQTICVQSFNAYTPAYASGIQSRLHFLAQALQKDPCDIIQFQELWKDRHFDQLAGEAPQFQFVRSDALRNDRSLTGIATAIQGRYGKKYSELYLVNNEEGGLDWFRKQLGVQKAFTAMEILLPDVNEPLLAINTHTHPKDPEIRLAQMVQVAYFLLITSQQKDLPVIFTGDLNADPNSLELAFLRDVVGLQDAYLTANGTYDGVCTYCSSNPLSWLSENHVFDYVLFRSSPQTFLRVEKAIINLKGPADSSPLSDHFGVRAYLRAEAKRNSPEPSPHRQLTLKKAREILEKRAQSATEFAPIVEMVTDIEKSLR